MKRSIKLSRLTNSQLKYLLRHGEVRFGDGFDDDFNIENYREFVSGLVRQYAGTITSSITTDRIFRRYKIPTEIQMKVKAQIGKVIGELQKLPGVIK